MQEVWDFIKHLFDHNTYVQYGLPLLLFVIFAETGLFIGFFLPGDSLVFIAGLTCATKPHLLNVNIVTLIASMCAAAIIGNIAGYLFGRNVGSKLFTRDDSFLFKKRHVITTQSFYNRHGGKTLIFGRFVPIVRTFAPILAGVIKIDFARFMLYNISGALAWIISFCGTAYYLGSQYPQIESYLGYIVLFLIVITAIPVGNAYLKSRRKAT